jgi:hypothetical protein
LINAVTHPVPPRASEITADTSSIEPYRSLFEELGKLAVFSDEARAIRSRVTDRYRSL